jgi:hypothetical protein
MQMVNTASSQSMSKLHVAFGGENQDVVDPLEAPTATMLPSQEDEEEDELGNCRGDEVLEGHYVDT